MRGKILSGDRVGRKVQSALARLLGRGNPDLRLCLALNVQLLSRSRFVLSSQEYHLLKCRSYWALANILTGIVNIDVKGGACTVRQVDLL